MQDILHQDYGPQIRQYLTEPISMPSCSPCYIKLSEEAFGSTDIPYDTVSCDSVCIGKWGPALRRLSIYTVSKLEKQLPKIVDVIRASGLNIPQLDDFALEIELRSGDKRWRFQMMSANGHLS